MLGLRLGEYPSTEGFQRYPRGRQPAYGNKGCSWSRGPTPGGPLSRLPLSRLVQSRSGQRPSGGSWFTFPSPLELRLGCSGLQPQPFASSSLERLVFLSSSKEKERGGDRNELLATRAGALGFTPRDIHDSSRSSPLSGHRLVVPYPCSGPSSRSAIRYRRSHRVRPARLPQRELSGGRLQVQPWGQKKLEYPEWTVLSQGQSRPLVTKPFFDR